MSNKLPDDTLLRGMAEIAFGMGLTDGRDHNYPRQSHAIMNDLKAAFARTSDGVAFLVVHRKKMRQVYGAGFDISRLHKLAETPR